MSTPIGTAMTAVTPAWIRVPWMAWIAPPPTSVELMLRWLLVHHDDFRSRPTPLLMTVKRIQTSGTMARPNDPHMTMRAMTSLTARPRDLWPRSRGVDGRGAESDGGAAAGAVRTANLRSAGAAPARSWIGDSAADTGWVVIR